MQTNPNPSPIFIGLDFLLKHLSSPEFPRTIATKLTEGKQIIVSSKEEALTWYANSNYLDCRLAAYPYVINGEPRIIDFVLLDLDLNNFKHSLQRLDRALSKILKSLGIQPTVMWTGNGYHVLIPIEPLPSALEDMTEFNKFEEPSKKILRWLEKHLSGGKSDFMHNRSVSFNNCMLRVPGSINSKHNNGKNEVKIIKQWDGHSRLSIEPLLGDFIAVLLDQLHEKPHKKYNAFSTFLSKP